MEEECSISLDLVAEEGFDPAELTKIIGLEPTRVRPGKRGSQIWSLTREGPTPVNARKAANDLARGFLADVSAAGPDRAGWRALAAAHYTKLTFRFYFDRLLNFSYVIDHDVVRALAELDALVDFRHYDAFWEETPMALYEERCEITLHVPGGEPTALAPRSGGDDAVAELLDAWTSLGRDDEVRIGIAYKVRHMTGRFTLLPGTVTKLASCRAGLGAALYDWGPHGADLLG